MENPGRCFLNQETEVNVTCDRADQHHVAFDMKRMHHACVIFIKVRDLNTILRKTVHKYQVWVCLKNNRPLFLEKHEGHKFQRLKTIPHLKEIKN